MSTDDDDVNNGLSGTGTGGSSGVGWLRKVVEHRFFPELWSIRSELQASYSFQNQAALASQLEWRSYARADDSSVIARN